MDKNTPGSRTEDDSSSGVRGGEQVNADDQMEAQDAQESVIPRRFLLSGLGSVALAGLAGCNEMFGSTNEENAAPQPETPTSTPESETEIETETDTDTQTEEEELAPEDFDDGCGDAGPGSSVRGTRASMEFAIRPAGRSHSTDEENAESGTPTPSSASIKEVSQTVSSIAETNRTQSQTACETQTISVDNRSQRALNLNPSSARIYPGSILDVDSVWKGQMRPITADRAPIRISFSLPGTQFDGSSSRVVSDPSLSSVRDGINELLRSVNERTSSQSDMDYVMHSVHSRRQTHVNIGAHFNGLSENFGLSFGGSQQSQTSKVVVKYRQRYFSVDVDIPNAFFADGRTPAANEAIVSSVTYGRLLLFSAESSHEKQGLKASLNAAIGNIGGSLDADQEQVLNESSIHVTALGGSGSAASEVITNGYEGIDEYISAGADYSPDSPGYPLSYQLTYLSDFSIAQVEMGTEYERRSCGEYSFLIEDISFTGLQTDDGLFDNEIEVYGTVKIQARGLSSESGDGATQIESAERGDITPTPENGTSNPTETPDAKQVSSDIPEETLWSAPEGGGDMLYLSEDDTMTIGDSEFSFPVSEDDAQPSARLRIVAELYEHDSHTDEEYKIGSQTEDIQLSELAGNSENSNDVSMEISREGSSVQVKMTLNRIG